MKKILPFKTLIILLGTVSICSASDLQQLNPGEEIIEISVHTPPEIEIEIPHFYAPASLKGVPATYKFASLEELKEAHDFISQGIEKLNTREAFNEWKNSSSSYFSYYKSLIEAAPISKGEDLVFTKKPKLPKKEIYLSLLQKYVLELERNVEGLRDNTFSSLQWEKFSNHYFPTIQHSWNLCMLAYERLSSNTTEFVGQVFNQYYRNALFHLLYTRDKEGFLLFNVFPAEELKIENNLYKTYIPYGERKNEFYNEREFFFSYKNGGKDLYLFSNNGYLIEKGKNNEIRLFPHTGAYGLVPHTNQKALIFSYDYNDIEREEIDRKVYLDLYQPPKDLIFANEQERIQGENLSRYIKMLLGKNDSQFIASPYSSLSKNPLQLREGLEAEYIFLTENLKCLEVNQGDDNALFALEYFHEAYPDMSIEEIKEDYETRLKELYTKEEQQVIEAEQQERIKMITGESPHSHYGKPKEKKNIFTSKKSKYKKTTSKSVTVSEAPTSSTTGPNLNERVNKRLEKLKFFETRKNYKYRKWLQSINVLVQEARKDKINISGGLNKSSHGKFEIENHSQPTYRPHGGRDTVHPKSAKDVLQNIWQDCWKSIGKNKKSIKG